MRRLALLLLVALASVLLGLKSPVAAGYTGTPKVPGIFRAFPQSSIWNAGAAEKGTVTSSNPYAGAMGSSLLISGVPPNVTYAKPAYFAAAGDPCVTWRDVNGWAHGDIAYQGECIPLPAGAKAAPGSDGHLTIITADRRWEYDFWRADIATRTAEVIVRFDLRGSGVPGDTNDNTSARGSGTPLYSTTVHAPEAVYGLRHALGLTVPHVASTYITPPATHSDGSSGPVQYGMLFVLRPDFPTPSNPAAANIVRALKDYGAYVVDQGASCELDADSTRSAMWQRAGLTETSLNAVRCADFRFVQP